MNTVTTVRNRILQLCNERDNVSPTSKPRNSVGSVMEYPLMWENTTVIVPMSVPNKSKITTEIYFAKTRLLRLTGNVISYLLHFDISSARSDVPIFTTNKKTCIAII